MLRNSHGAVGVTLLVCFPIFIAGCALFAGSSIMSYEEYSQLDISTPYLLELQSGSGRLLYFGVEHTAYPEHPQLAQLEKLWEDFQPAVAFSEGGVWPLLETREAAICRCGEGGLLRFLAERDSIPIFSLEPSSAAEIARLRRSFSPECIKTYYILRQVTQWRRQQSDEPLEEYTQKVMDKLSATPGLAGPPRRPEELEESCRRYLPELDDWRHVPADWFYPTKTGTLMNQIARRCNRIRDEHMVKLLTAEVKRGSRVFAVVGFSHVVMQERALRNALK